MKILTASFIIILTSCNSYKETSNEVKRKTTKNDEQIKAMDKEMIGEGFQLGVVKHLKESECSYIIIDQVTKAQFDPINITEESYKAMRNDGEKVYYKYRPLRRMNRCTEANPIELVDIKKREG
jgi:hypothetical protein